MKKSERKRVLLGRRVPIQSLVLRTLAVAGGIGLAVVAPQLVRLFPYADRPKQGRVRTRRRVQQAIARLLSKGLVTVKNGSVALTDRGKAQIENILASSYQIAEPAFWDGRWRVIAFDVFERSRPRRDRLRRLLAGAGFVRLQDSVWVYPYPCDEFVQLIRARLGNRAGELYYVTAEGLQPDAKLRAHFKLS